MDTLLQTFSVGIAFKSPVHGVHGVHNRDGLGIGMVCGRVVVMEMGVGMGMDMGLGKPWDMGWEWKKPWDMGMDIGDGQQGPGCSIVLFVCLFVFLLGDRVKRLCAVPGANVMGRALPPKPNRGGRGCGAVEGGRWGPLRRGAPAHRPMIFTFFCCLLRGRAGGSICGCGPPPSSAPRVCGVVSCPRG